MRADCSHNVGPLESPASLPRHGFGGSHQRGRVARPTGAPAGPAPSHQRRRKHAPAASLYRWLLIQAGTHIALPVSPSEKQRGVRREMDVLPRHVIAFETEPGEGCESANLGLCQYPSEVSAPGFGKRKTKLKGWSWDSFCKTHYASDPRCGGLPNFLRCHLGVVALLDEAQKIGVLGKVNDEGDFWETRSLERLTKEIGEQSAMLAARRVQDARG